MDPLAASLPELIAWSSINFADDPAVRDGDVTLSYRELGDHIDRAARAMIASGIDEGDRVAVWGPNCWQWIVAALAATRAGALLVPINTRFKGPEAAYVLAKAHVKLLFVADGFLDTDYSGSLAAESLPDLAEIVDLVEATSSATTSFDEFLTRESQAHQAGAQQAGAKLAGLQDEVERRSAATGPDDVALIMFTSGTTGHPKGVLVKGGAIIRAFWGYARDLTVRRGDIYLLVNPYFHAFGFNSGVVVCLLYGAVNVPVAVYEPTEVLETIERERITVFPGPPALFQGLLNHPELGNHDLSSLRACVTGAASIPVEMIVAMRERLGFETVMTAYGMTETSGIASHTRPGDSPELVASTSGRAIPDVELKIVTDSGHDAATGEPGELLVRGFQVTAGYLDDPEQTAEAIDADGWLHTGDIAVMNEAGYIDITDRKKDMFIMGGFNVYPVEVERLLGEHPDVGMVAVIGIPEERMGEVGAAFVVAAPGCEPDPEELMSWCRARMANYKVPRQVWVVDELPLNASNKVRKPDLRIRARELLG